MVLPTCANCQKFSKIRTSQSVDESELSIQNCISLMICFLLTCQTKLLLCNHTMICVSNDRAAPIVMKKNDTSPTVTKTSPSGENDTNAISEGSLGVCSVVDKDIIRSRYHLSLQITSQSFGKFPRFQSAILSPAVMNVPQIDFSDYIRACFKE
jgi:hypothetical protein